MKISKFNRKRKFARIFGIIALSCAVTATPLTIIGTKNVVADEVTNLENEKQNVQSDIDELQSQLNGYITEISNLELKAADLNNQIAQAEDDLKVAEANQQKQYEDMKLRIQYMYENQTSSIEEAVVTATDMGDMLNKSEYFQKIYDYDRDSLQELADTTQQITDLKDQLNNDMNQLIASQEEAQTKSTELTQLIESKRETVSDLDSRIADAQAAAAAEAAAAAQKQEEERLAAEARVANNTETTSSSSNSRTSSNANSSSNSNTTVDDSDDDDDSGSTNSSSNKGSQSISGSSVIAAAQSMIGVPYVWGGESTSGVDCSGLVKLCYATQGISLPHSSAAQATYGTSVSISEAQPGDIVCYSGHVGIYAGNGQMIHAPQPGSTVTYCSIYILGGPTSIRRL